jgi:hypothetical protein
MSTVTITVRPAAGAGPAGAPRTAFVPAGGAALGAMQAGMVHALHERGITPGPAGRHLGRGPERRVPRLPPRRPWPPPNNWRPSGAGCVAATSSRSAAHGRGLGTMRSRISAKP